jgi:hypothetical protein
MDRGRVETNQKGKLICQLCEREGHTCWYRFRRNYKPKKNTSQKPNFNAQKSASAVAPSYGVDTERYLGLLVDFGDR